MRPKELPLEGIDHSVPSPEGWPYGRVLRVYHVVGEKPPNLRVVTFATIQEAANLQRSIGGGFKFERETPEGSQFYTFDELIELDDWHLRGLGNG